MHAGDRRGEPRRGRLEAPVDAALASAVAEWKTKLDRALGEEIGYTATGFGKDSTEIIRWIAGAYRAELKIDVTLISSGGIRQVSPKGAITKATLWSILPFDNKLVICKLKGRDLLADLETERSGVCRRGEDQQGIPARGRQSHRAGGHVLCRDDRFSLLRGSSFQFQKQDPSAKRDRYRLAHAGGRVDEAAQNDDRRAAGAAHRPHRWCVPRRRDTSPFPRPRKGTGE